jgi:hypothetical protein
LPRDGADYLEVAPSAIAYLTLLFAAGALGLCLTSRRREPSVDELGHGIAADLPVVLLGMVVLFFAYQSTQAFFNIRLTGEATAESLLQFIFFDQAYLMLLPILVSLGLTRFPSRRRRLATRFGLILFLFYLQATLGNTSRGFILTLFTVSFVIPISYLQGSREVRLFVPSKKGFITAVVMAVPMFLVAQVMRVSAFSGQPISTELLLNTLRPGDSQILSVLGDVFYRFAAGVDRYILIFDSHLYNGHSVEYGMEYGTYLAKNLANLLLPGTPYPEAYTQSSNLLLPVLFKQPMLGDRTKVELLRTLNTQPYTFYGVAVILAGRLAPVLVFGLVALVGLAYRWTRGVPARIGLIAFYNLLISSYAFEVNVATALHFTGSLLVFIWMMRSARWLRHPTGTRRRKPAGPGLNLPGTAQILENKGFVTGRNTASDALRPDGAK